MRKTINCDAGLLKLLQQSDIEEIDFLVDVLTDEGSGRLALPSSIKDILLEQKTQRRYSEEGLRSLLHELQAYGGHSMMNLFRSQPVAYEKILTDVHKKLNGKESKSKSVRDKEHEIALSLFGRNWESLSDHERWSRCIDTRVVCGFFNMRENLKLDANGVALGLSTTASAAAFAPMRLSPPLAAVSALRLAVRPVSEAYRVTIPFVAQIARIKMLARKTFPNRVAAPLTTPPPPAAFATARPATYTARRTG